MSMDPNTEQMMADLLEYKKLVGMLEGNLEQKQNEIKALNDELKAIKLELEKMQKENNELNSKIIKSYHDINSLEDKHSAELENQKRDTDRMKEAYEEQLRKLSSYNPEEDKKRIEDRINSEYKVKLQQKDAQISDLESVINECKKNYEILKTEYQLYKTDAAKEISKNNEFHQKELAQMANKFELQSMQKNMDFDKETFKEIKNELDNSRKSIETLQNEIENLRREKEEISLKKNELEIAALKREDEDRFNNKLLSGENERLKSQIQSMQLGTETLNKNVNEKDENLNKLTEEKLELVNLLRERENDFSALQNDLTNLKNQFDKHEFEKARLAEKFEEEKKNSMIQNRTKEENYQRSIEQLEDDLKDAKKKFSDFYNKTKTDLQTTERDLALSNEENHNLRMQNTDLREYLEKLQKNYEELDDAYIRNSRELEDYKKQTNDLEQCYRNLQKKKYEMDKESRFKKKYEYYKEQCLKANQRHEIALSFLDSDLKQKIYDAWIQNDLAAE